jgi:probable DNA metabolism protein
LRQVRHANTFDGWRAAARACLRQGEAPGTVTFLSAEGNQPSLFGDGPLPQTSASSHAGGTVALPAAFLAAAKHVAVHADADRWDLMYRIVWRMGHGEPHLLTHAADADVLAFGRLARAVHRDIHKCHAYVRFRPVADANAPGEQHWVAWHRPDHDILALAAPHFLRRFGATHWTILSPTASATHRGAGLVMGPGCPRQETPEDDSLEDLWRVYYANIFNPARLNPRAMRQEMPRRYWQTMPETQLIDGLVKNAAQRSQDFIAAQPPRAQVERAFASLEDLKAAAQTCTACDWCHRSTQVVCGTGPAAAEIMLVGEQPGDQEDLAGTPFVGPAGAVLTRALAAAGLAQTAIYTTNAVKHFKWTPQGKRRLHQRPSPADVAACKPWLAAELGLVRPRVLICLGTTAALAVLGKAVRLRDVRGQRLRTAACDATFVTAHPSAILRTSPEAQPVAFAQLVQDLQQATATAHNP